MADGIVGWHFFDAEAGIVPEELRPSILPRGGKGRIVVLAATPLAQAEGWASRAVVAIARGWAQEDLRIFLMDLGLDAPSLHKALGLPNREGVSDAFLYGASVQRIAQPALDDAIFFAPAGTATTDPAQILGHLRWNDLAGGFSEVDATLLLFLPTDIPGADKILSRATDILFLAGQGESAESCLGPTFVKVVAMLGPMGSPTEGTEAPTESGDHGEVEPEMAAAGSPGLPGDLPIGGELEGDAPTRDLDRGLRLVEGFAGEIANENADLVLQDFGEEVWISDDLAGESALDRAGIGDQGIPDNEVPDFEAEFAELPDIGPEAEAAGGGGQFGGDIVRGSGFISGGERDAFGPPVTEGAEGAEMAPVSRPDPSPPRRTRPLSEHRVPPKKRSPIPVVAGAATLLAVLIAAVGTALGIFNVPGFGWLQGLFEEVPYPELTLPGPQPNEPVLRYSLELDVYEEERLGDALVMRNTLRDRLPSLIFNLTPLDSEGVVSFALYAGPATDAVEAENLRGPLAEILTREDPESWRIRATPRGFYLGERGTLAEAQEYLATVEGAGALGYIIHVTYPNGTEAYEVLSGAFEGVSDARGWQLTLLENGFRDVPLIERRGRPPA